MHRLRHAARIAAKIASGLWITTEDSRQVSVYSVNRKGLGVGADQDPHSEGGNGVGVGTTVHCMHVCACAAHPNNILSLHLWGRARQVPNPIPGELSTGAFLADWNDPESWCKLKLHE